jgi:hypothetical protein
MRQKISRSADYKSFNRTHYWYGYYNGWGKALKPEINGQSQVRNRFGIDASYTASRFLIRGEYILGHDGKTERQGWYLHAGYFVLEQKLQILARYDTFDPNTSVTENIFTSYTIGLNLNFNAFASPGLYTFREEGDPITTTISPYNTRLAFND